MNFAKSDRVRFQRTKILRSKKGQSRQIKNNKNKHFANLTTEGAKCSLIDSFLNYSDTTQNKYLLWKNRNAAVGEQSENNRH